MATSYQDDFIKTALRMPRDLHARVMESSRDKGRSFNAELIHILTAYFDGLDASSAQPHTAKSLSEMASKFALEASSHGGSTANLWEDQQRSARENLERLISQAIGTSVQEAIKELQEQERRERERWIEQISGMDATKALVSGLSDGKEQAARHSSGALPKQTAKPKPRK